MKCPYCRSNQEINRVFGRDSVCNSCGMCISSDDDCRMCELQLMPSAATKKSKTSKYSLGSVSFSTTYASLSSPEPQYVQVPAYATSWSPFDPPAPADIQGYKAAISRQATKKAVPKKEPVEQAAPENGSMPIDLKSIEEAIKCQQIPLGAQKKINDIITLLKRLESIGESPSDFRQYLSNKIKMEISDLKDQ